ncbi:MAG: hypothetical protein WC451_05015 [Patescibacteria group bacterium]|jgi:hypothetical protein
MSKKTKKKKKKNDDDILYINRNNPAYLSWREILDKYNNGSNQTIFGTIEREV